MPGISRIFPNYFLPQIRMILTDLLLILLNLSNAAKQKLDKILEIPGKKTILTSTES